MESNELIGTVAFTSDNRYINSSTNKENKDFQKKSKNTTANNNRDTVEFTCDKEIELKSENYENYTHKKTIQKQWHSFGNEYGYKRLTQISQAIWEYCYGEMTDEQIQQALIDECKKMRMYQMQIGNTSGVNEKDNSQIIGDVYEYFQKYNVRYMVNKCFEDGVDIANANGGSENNNWVYYDSKYYDKSEHLRSLLREAANEVATEWNLDSIDFDKVENESNLIVDGKLDFNSVWDYRAHQRNICSLSSEWQPQEHFTFFYQSYKYKVFQEEVSLESQFGICIIGFGNHKWTMDVPFNNYAVCGDLADCFNAKDLFVKNISFMEPILLKYLEHFQIYTRFYAHNQAMKGEW